MSFSQTWGHSVAIALDQLAAAIFFNRMDITVSSLCCIVLRADAGDVLFRKRLESLNLHPWQVDVLRWIGAQFLERFWPGHCEEARVGDLQRNASADALLSIPG